MAQLDDDLNRVIERLRANNDSQAADFLKWYSDGYEHYLNQSREVGTVLFEKFAWQGPILECLKSLVRVAPDAGNQPLTDKYVKLI